MFLGEPLPSLSWKKDGAAIPNIEEAFTYVHNEEDQSVLARLSIPRAQLADSGTYSLLAENRKNNKLDISRVEISFTLSPKNYFI